MVSAQPETIKTIGRGTQREASLLPAFLFPRVAVGIGTNYERMTFGDRNRGTRMSNGTKKKKEVTRDDNGGQEGFNATRDDHNFWSRPTTSGLSHVGVFTAQPIRGVHPYMRNITNDTCWCWRAAVLDRVLPSSRIGKHKPHL